MPRARNRTTRWLDDAEYLPDWIERNRALAGLFLAHEYRDQARYSCAEFGSGPHGPMAQAFADMPNVSVRKYDIKAWDEETQVFDLNAEKAAFPQADIFSFSGVLEYVNHVEPTLQSAMQHCQFALISYAFLATDFFVSDAAYLEQVHSRSVRNGWRNHFSSAELIASLSRCGVIAAVDVWNERQALVLLRNFQVDKDALSGA